MLKRVALSVGILVAFAVAPFNQVLVEGAPAPHASANFYCNLDFSGSGASFIRLPAGVTFTLFKGTNPHLYRLGLHQGQYSLNTGVQAILPGGTIINIPEVPGSVDVEGAQVDIKNTTTQDANVCYALDAVR
jgi:hypothetical protein